MSYKVEKLQEIGHAKICPSIAIMRGRQILIGLRHYTPDKWKAISVWTCPGGRCDEGETVEATLRREVAEEVGVTDLHITDFLGEMPGAKEGDTLYFFIGTTDQEPSLMEPEKFSEWRWEDIDSVPENFISPKALDLVRAYLKKQ